MARFLRLYRRTDTIGLGPAGDILVAPQRSPWKLQDGGCEGSMLVYLWCYVCCHGNWRYLEVENREIGGSTPTSMILTLDQLNILT